MNRINVYMQEINNIFSCLGKLEELWPNKDNVNFISNLKEYREDVISYKNDIENADQQSQNINTLEEN